MGSAPTINGRTRELYHFNNHQLCALAIKTSGPTPGVHDLIEIGVVLLDYTYDMVKGSSPMTMSLQMKRPDAEHMKLNLEKQRDTQKGFDPYDGAEHFETWFESLNLARGKKLMPVCTDWGLTYGFLLDWLGPLHCDYFFFSRQARDLSIIATHYNDLQGRKHEDYLYAKVHLRYLAHKVAVECDRDHKRDTLDTCRVLIDVHKRMCNHSINYIRPVVLSDAELPEGVLEEE